MSKRRNKFKPASIRVQKRPCPIKDAGIKKINYKDVEFLKNFLTEGGKILPRRITGVCSKNQKYLATAIKQARNIALLSFSEGYVPQQTEQT